MYEYDEQARNEAQKYPLSTSALDEIGAQVESQRRQLLGGDPQNHRIPTDAAASTDPGPDAD
jgi:hypothetical protein